MEVIPGLYRVDGVQGNCYLVDRDELVLVDTGLVRRGRKILGCIRDEVGRNPRDLALIVLTHHHADHTGNAAELRRATGARIAVHEADAEYVAGRRSMPPLGGLRGRLLGPLLSLWQAEPADADLLLRDGDRIGGLKCIHTPGHTPGSICLYDPTMRALFSGDTLVTRKGAVSGPPPSATPDMAGALRSAGRLASLDVDVLLPGHGAPIATGASRRIAEFLAPTPLRRESW